MTLTITISGSHGLYFGELRSSTPEGLLSVAEGRSAEAVIERLKKLGRAWLNAYGHTGPAKLQIVDKTELGAA